LSFERKRRKPSKNKMDKKWSINYIPANKKKLVLVSLGLSGREECHESVLNFHLIKEKID
jgi:hypothetical protein